MESEDKRGEMDSRSVPGEGITHEQNWVEERLTEATNTDEFAAAADRLEQEVRDLQAPATGGGAGGAVSATGPSDIQNQSRGDRMSVRTDAHLDPGRGGQIDPDQAPPEAEARATVNAHLADGA